jgi:hypothetical protein
MPACIEYCTSCKGGKKCSRCVIAFDIVTLVQRLLGVDPDNHIK